MIALYFFSLSNPLIQYIMSRFQKYGKSNPTFADCKRQKGELRVRHGLSVPPSKMIQMAEQGVSISTTNATQFYDGSDNPSFDLPLDVQRGIDVATLWEEQRSIKSKMANNLSTDIQNFG